MDSGCPGFAAKFARDEGRQDNAARPLGPNGNTGLEVPTKYIEWLAPDPEDMADLWRKTKFRETLQLVLQSLF